MKSRNCNSDISNFLFCDTLLVIYQDTHAKIRVYAREKSVRINAQRPLHNEITKYRCVRADCVRLVQSGLQSKVAHATIGRARLLNRPSLSRALKVILQNPRAFFRKLRQLIIVLNLL